MSELKMKINSGIDLWKKAKQLIPGGNQLLSKRTEMFLPDAWPSYYEKAKGVEVWDLDGNKYYDMSIMGIGSCVLGYANDAVDKAVKKAIDRGSMSTLNCYEEVELAQKLIELHPWGEMVRFARTGGEANAIAIRIARAYSKKDKIAFCGYHGWHDWYLSSNLADESSLDEQLLPGLKSVGVPRNLKNTSLPFNYGKFDELSQIFQDNPGQIGVIIMEVEKSKKIDVEFLKAVRQLADQNGAVLIFDEISSGFRINIGGMHLIYGIIPDIVVLGKALGNGFPISAVVGKSDVMQAAQNTFISSTYWTERIGFVAALETIKQFQESKVIEHIVAMGEYIREGLRNIFCEHHLKINLTGLPSVIIMEIEENDDLYIKTIFTQEMLKRGFLASNLIYVSYAHNKDIVDEYLRNVDDVVSLIAERIKNGTLRQCLEGEVCHSGFKRLN